MFVFVCGIVGGAGGGFVNCREVSAGLSGLMQRFFEGLYRVLYTTQFLLERETHR